MKRTISFLLPLLFLTFISDAQPVIKWVNVTTDNLPEVVKLKRNSMDAKVTDIDGDGDPDIVLAIEFYKNVMLINDGSGKFSDGSHLLPDKNDTISPKPYKYYPYHDSEDVAVEDFNKDGRPDILIVTEDDKINEWYIQNTDGSFQDASDQLPVTGVTNVLIAGDFDSDGWVDVVLANNGQNYYLRNENGQFIDETETRLPKIKDVSQDLEANDFDKDGDLDLLVGNEDDNRLLINNGKGVFTDATLEYFSNGISEETREADFGDVDGDGNLDIFFANVKFFTQKAPVQRLLIFEEGKYVDRSETHLQLGTKNGVVDADFFDLDDDGNLDLLTSGVDGFHIALNNGKGMFTDASEKLFPPIEMYFGVDIEVADFNMDGIPDIYLANFRSSDVLLFGQ